jgi:formylglycine-generating enzyme required for sulfatase activity
MKMHVMLAALALLAIAGCGGSHTDGFADSYAQGRAPFAIVDLDAKRIDYRARIDDLATNPAYRSSLLVFRRVVKDSHELFVGVFELTQGQWQRLAGTTPWTAVDSHIIAASAQVDDRPAYNLDHLAVMLAVGGCQLTAGSYLDLPTDDEWTMACGVASGWWWGSTATAAELAANAVVQESVITVDRMAIGHGRDTGGPLAVGSRQANHQGLYDMQGNVWEWTKEGTWVRGGSWRDPAMMCRAEVRAGAAAGVDNELEHALIGARLVLRP